MKMSKDSSAKYYQKKTKKGLKKSCERYQDLSEEEKNKKLQYGCEQFKNLPENENQRLVE